MKPPPHFQIGDRVALIYSMAGIAIGTTGTVVKRFIGGSLCDVQFDGHIGTRVVDGESLRWCHLSQHGTSDSGSRTRVAREPHAHE
jgi:hypothetical protein